ncbi:helix-turn-helix domain-containing protein [Brevibacterium sp. 5221]|uniref:Helix-turn-helix domain-containing protein n=1 Tax=Brevibacterium rongguiense TaxID=2695267 RepID=A0A6N9H5J5_9MICO|nr:helix-turn-helix transcriptional regulator [Brevibacterium rongguiense]MYM19163.1 helix-turn-helix domain-containing protein [Brevibacterium rongguiense]
MSAQAVAAAAAFLQARLGEPIGWEDAAAHVGYSAFHFSRMFARRTAMSPGRYLAVLRFHAAKRLLLAADDDVVDVCTAVGFASHATFTRRFAAVVGTPPARFRRLADALAERSTQPFAIGASTGPAVRVSLRLPERGLRRPWHVWLGWYPEPVPIGLPTAGVLVEGDDDVELPLCPGAPHLLGFAVDPTAEALAQLAPDAPLVSGWPRPLRAPAAVTLTFAAPPRPAVPLLSALPSLAP